MYSVSIISAFFVYHYKNSQITAIRPKKGQFVIYVTQTKVTTNEANHLSFTYNEDKIPTGVSLTIKNAEL